MAQVEDLEIPIWQCTNALPVCASEWNRLISAFVRAFAPNFVEITYHHCWWRCRWIWLRCKNILKYRCWDDQSLGIPCIVYLAYHDNIDDLYQLDQIGCLQPYSTRAWCPSVSETFYSLLMLCIWIVVSFVLIWRIHICIVFHFVYG